MNVSVLKSTKLYFRNASSDKEYHVSLEQKGDLYVVNIAYGRRGNANRSGTKTQTPVTLEQAEKVYDKTVRDQLAEGYTQGGDATPFSGVDTAGRVTGLLPMLLFPITEEEIEPYMRDEDWMMQEKLDGKRIMVRVSNGVVVASNRKGLSVGLPSEIESALATRENIVLDGELVGSTYHVFDLLEIDSDDLRNVPYSSRFTVLVASMSGLNSVKLVEFATFEDHKRQMYDSLKHREGVVFKRMSSSYVPGRVKPGGDQLKCKFWSSASVCVTEVNSKRSVKVCVVDDDGKNVPVGSVTVPPNCTVPEVGAIVEVKYLYAYKGGSLIQPIYLGERDDVDCDSINELKYKSEDSDD